MTCICYNARIWCGEIWRWSLSGLEGLKTLLSYLQSHALFLPADRLGIHKATEECWEALRTREQTLQLNALKKRQRTVNILNYGTFPMVVSRYLCLVEILCDLQKDEREGERVLSTCWISNTAATSLALRFLTWLERLQTRRGGEMQNQKSTLTLKCLCSLKISLHQNFRSRCWLCKLYYTWCLVSRSLLQEN